MSGSKANNLKVLRSIGLLVPEFYEISDAVLKQLGAREIDQQLTNDFHVWRQRYDITTVAVRSSADAEDSQDQSFAGQFRSVMNVTSNQEFLKALGTVHASRPQPGYAKQKRYKVNAIVQRYIAPDAAGVLFTVNPANGLPEMIINAVAGHGGKVVDGAAAISFQVDRLSGDIRTANSRNYSLLSKSQLVRLTVMGQQVERQMGCPQDIEWAFRGDELFALQARPVTRITHLKAWDNANIGESFPGIIMPLTFSIARRGYELVYKSQALEGGLNWYQLEANHRLFHDMVGLFSGRMYYNLASWYKFIGLFPSNDRNQKYLDEQLQTVGDVVYLPPSAYPLKQKIRFYSKALRRTVFFEREKRRYWRKLDESFEQYDSLPAGRALPLLLDRYAFVEQMIVPHMGRSADNDFFVMTYHGLLKNKLCRWLGDENAKTTDFLGSLRDVISARQAELLTAIASHINHDQIAARLLLDKQYQQLDKHLLVADTQPLLVEYRTNFLHRFAGDQKIETVNPLLTLVGFYELIATYCLLDEQNVAARRTAALSAESLRRQTINGQLSRPQKIIYGLLLNRLKHHLRIREHNRLLRGKTYALLRGLFQEVGAVLASDGLIAAAADVYYLDIEEILRLVNGTGFNDDIQQIITARKLRYKTYSSRRAPSRFITAGLTNELPEAAATSNSKWTARKSLPGTLSSPGNVQGTVIVLDAPIIPKKPFDILVVSHTDPGWTPLIALAKGVIVEHGGILSHAAIVTRELGIPSMIGVEHATEVLRDGMKVRINNAKSTVDILSSDEL